MKNLIGSIAHSKPSINVEVIFFLFCFCSHLFRITDSKKLTGHATTVREPQWPVVSILRVPSPYVWITSFACFQTFYFMDMEFFFELSHLLLLPSPLTIHCECTPISLAIILQYCFHCWWYFIVWICHGIWGTSNIYSV